MLQAPLFPPQKRNAEFQKEKLYTSIVLSAKKPYNGYMSEKLITIENVSKSFDEVKVLENMNLYIRENEFLTLLGPSGCGKTTLLRILGGFEEPDTGRVMFEGKDITSLAPNKRQLNTVFQKDTLFYHMSVADNRLRSQDPGQVEVVHP